MVARFATVECGPVLLLAPGMQQLVTLSSLIAGEFFAWRSSALLRRPAGSPARASLQESYKPTLVLGCQFHDQTTCTVVHSLDASKWNWLPLSLHSRSTQLIWP
jgi:hypothetical protein